MRLDCGSVDFSADSIVHSLLPQIADEIDRQRAAGATDLEIHVPFDIFRAMDLHLTRYLTSASQPYRFMGWPVYPVHSPGLWFTVCQRHVIRVGFGRSATAYVQDEVEP